MAWFGDGRGLQILVGVAVAVVIASLPVYFVDLDTPDYRLAAQADGRPGVVQVVRAGDGLELTTELAPPPPLTAAWSLRVELRDPASGQRLAGWVDREPRRWPDHPARIATSGTLPAAALPAGAEVVVGIHLRAAEAEAALLRFRGRYLPGELTLQDLEILAPPGP